MSQLNVRIDCYVTIVSSDYTKYLTANNEIIYNSVFLLVIYAFLAQPTNIYTNLLLTATNLA